MAGLYAQESFEATDKVVDFLLPSGILIPLPCQALTSLEDIKDKLWKEAQAYPLFGLKGPEWYTLVFVNCKAEQEECLDESQRLCDVQMYKPLFKVGRSTRSIAQRVTHGRTHTHTLTHYTHTLVGC